MAILICAIPVTGIENLRIHCVLWNITCSMLVWGLKFFGGSTKIAVGGAIFFGKN